MPFTGYCICDSSTCIAFRQHSCCHPRLHSSGKIKTGFYFAQAAVTITEFCSQRTPRTSLIQTRHSTLLCGSAMSDSSCRKRVSHMQPYCNVAIVPLAGSISTCLRESRSLPTLAVTKICNLPSYCRAAACDIRYPDIARSCVPFPRPNVTI